MAAIPDTGTLTGQVLTDFLIKTILTLRAVGLIFANFKPPANPAGAGALRYLGPSFLGLVPKARALLAATINTGAFIGLGFGLAEYDQAVARATDAHESDTMLAVLAKDAHATASGALQNLALMTMQIIQAYFSTVNLPSADPKVKELLKAAGAKIEAAIAPIRSSRKGSRIANAAVKEKDTAIHTLEMTVQQYQTEETVHKAQDGLKLQILTGEPLRPKDLVVTEVPAVAEPVVKAGTKGAKANVSAAAPASAAAQKVRRKSPR